MIPKDISEPSKSTSQSYRQHESNDVINSILNQPSFDGMMTTDAINYEHSSDFLEFIAVNESNTQVLVEPVPPTLKLRPDTEQLMQMESQSTSLTTLETVSFGDAETMFGGDIVNFQFEFPEGNVGATDDI